MDHLGTPPTTAARMSENMAATTPATQAINMHENEILRAIAELDQGDQDSALQQLFSLLQASHEHVTTRRGGA